MMGAPLIRCEAVSVQRDDKTLLEEFSSEFGPGLTGLVGPNGAGKSTLLRCLAGLETPSSGSIAVGGVALAALAAEDRARRISYLAQDPVIHWPVSAREIVSLGRLPHHDAETEYGISACARAMDLTGTHALAERNCLTLSGGERARLLLARAIAVEAPILLADEPTAALDLEFRLAAFTLLRKLADDGCAVVAAFHDMAMAERYADRVIVLEGGRLAAQGQPADVLSDELIARIFKVRQGAAGRFGPGWEPVGRDEITD